MSLNTRGQEIASVLRTEILRNQYRPGERLPSERDLAARFNTTRGAIREVLKGLEQLGIINIQAGGARIVPKEEATLEILDYLLTIDGYPNPKLIDNYLQVFKMITVLSAEQSVTIATDEQIEYIIECIAKIKLNPTDEDAMREGWTVLFDYFMEINDNLVMRLVANGLKGQFLKSKIHSGPKPKIDEGLMLNILNGMIRAAKQRDSKLMGEIVGQYFEWVRNLVSDAFAGFLATHEPAKQLNGKS